MAGINDINDLTFAKYLDLQAFSKFLFGGFVGFQGLIVEKIWKWPISRNLPPPARHFSRSAFPRMPHWAPLKEEALGQHAAEKLECPEIVSLKRKGNRGGLTMPRQRGFSSDAAFLAVPRGRNSDMGRLANERNPRSR